MTDQPTSAPDERLREAREDAAWHRENDGLDLIVALDDEVTRLDAVVTAVRDVLDEMESNGDYSPYEEIRRALDGGI